MVFESCPFYLITFTCEEFNQRLTQGELKADGPVSDFPVNHGGFKQRPKQQKILLSVCAHLYTLIYVQFHNLDNISHNRHLA